MPGVAPTVQRMPTVACARACGAEHDPDSGVDCVQIAATVHDTVNSCSPDAGGELCRMYVVVTQVQAQRGHVRPGPARARPGPGVLRAEGTGRRPATTGLRTSISNPFETVKSADFRGKICVVNGGKYAFSLSGLVPNSELSGSLLQPPHRYSRRIGSPYFVAAATKAVLWMLHALKTIDYAPIMRHTAILIPPHQNICPAHALFNH